MRTYSIKEVSDIFHIPKSTLRYWEDEHLIYSLRNDDNEYREYTTEQLITIADIIFYRSLNLPIKSLKNIYSKSIDDTITLLHESHHKIEQQITQLKSVQDKIDQRLHTCETYETLKLGTMKLSRPNFSSIVHIHLSQKESVKNYVKDQSILSFAIDADEVKVVRYGFSTNQSHLKDNCLWEMEECYQYHACLLKLVEGVIDSTLLQPHIDYLKQHHKQVKRIIGSYLITDKNEDYFQCWIEFI